MTFIQSPRTDSVSVLREPSSEDDVSSRCRSNVWSSDIGGVSSNEGALVPFLGSISISTLLQFLFIFDVVLFVRTLLDTWLNSIWIARGYQNVYACVFLSLEVNLIVSKCIVLG